MPFGACVPKREPANAGGLTFTDARTGAEAFLSGRAGKALVLAEDAAFCAMLPAVRSPRAISVLWEGEALGLFALPEVCCVLAAGGADVMRAARFFAAVRRIPCALFPVSAALDGVFTAAGEAGAPPSAEIVCDEALMASSAGEGYARILLARLALFEARAAGMLRRAPFGGEAYERAFGHSDIRGEPQLLEIVRRNAALRICGAAGAPRGESAYMQGPAYARWRTLTALYHAFFAAGEPRRYFVPDYAARAAAAGVGYAALRIPSPQEYAARAIRFEQLRGMLLTELKALTARRTEHERALRTLGAAVPAPDLKLLRGLPERAEEGLTPLIRDFGLMDALI